MTKPSDWIPLFWPDETVSLEWLKGSPVNCLVVEKAAEGLARQATALGINVMAMSELEPQVAVIRKAKWPRVPVAARGKSRGISTGPTGAPWVDSNGWISSLTHVKTPGKPVWVATEPPTDAGMLRTEAYVLAVADAAVYGSRWIISLDADLRKGLAGGNGEALSTWKSIAEATLFFENNKQWRGYHTVAKLGVLSDFAGANEYLAGEVLNLCNRRYLPYRILDQASFDAKSLEGLKAILLVQQREPEARLHTLLGDFARAGGLVIAPASLAHLTRELQAAGNFEGSYDYYAFGEGRTAIARKPWSDPYQVVSDAHLLLSRKNDVLRLWNAGTTNARYTRGPNGAGLVQIVNYATRAFGHPVSLYVAHPYKSAKLVGLSGRTPEMLSVEARGEGVEVNLPPFPVYAAIEFGD
ncbi:MAG: hypothetical protein ABJF23_28565 [Bryobacteraceae bacterium]